MPAVPGSAPDDVLVLAHPETSHPHVDVPVLLVLLAVVGAVVVVAVARRHRETAAPPGDASATGSWAGSLGVPRLVTRTVAVALLAMAVVAGRVGVDDELDNLAPALVVGAGWPLLLIGALVAGPLWRWVDPWDTLARALERVLLPRGAASEPGAHVWPAVVVALPWLWLLAVHPRPLDPRTVGAALAAYSLFTVGGCLALGRARWLSSAEPVGLLLTWLGLVPRRRLGGWQPPRGAAALLGAITGGLLFAAVRRTELWSAVAVRSDAVWWASAALLGCSLLGAGLAEGAARVEARTTATPGAAVARALVPVAAGVALAVALGRNRFTTSVQLLPGLLGDPLGRGWDWLPAPTTLDPAPLGAAGLVALQLGLVACAHVLAAALATRSLVGDDRLPAIGVLALSATASVLALSLH